jgi:serine/threonine protein kinase/beta-lactam-binding protein with PASTA domain
MGTMPTGGDPPRLFDGRYQLQGRLGAGGMATVYLAEDTSLHRKVAIKVLAERYAEDEQFVERFRREAQSAAGLNHPNIVAIYDRGVAEGTYYIAMEYLDGPTLKDVIDERGGLDPNRAIGFATQILAALRFAHNHGVVHRDIKPHNVVVSPDGRLKVTDFGIARAGASQMTEVGSIVGTAQYLSPEQARGEVVGPPSDLYSVGIVLYEMLTGRVPFEGDSAVAIAMKHLSEEPVPPSVYAPGTPPALEQVVLRALAKDAGDRYQTAEEMSADLDRARRGVPLSPRTEQMTRVIAPSVTAQQTRVQQPHSGTRVWDRELPPPTRRAAPPPPPPPVRPRRSRWPWVLLAVLVLAAGAVAAVALTGVIGGGSDTPTTSTPAFARVPAGLVGLDEGTAIDRITSRGLKAVTLQRASTTPPGVVIRVTPIAGQRLRTGSTVTLSISQGVDTKTVPKIVGLSLADATTLLTQHGLQLGDQNEKYDLTDAGTVIIQDPAAGATAPVGSSVNVTVSKGPKDVLVPDLTGQDKQTAIDTLKQAGLNLGRVGFTSSATQPAGTVVSNDPPGGTQAADGSSVNVLLSNGPPKATMPEVYGQKIEDAVQAIQNAGLVPRTPSTFPTNDPALDGTVRKTSPQPGVPVRQGSKVIISVYAYTAPTTDTTTTDTTTTDTTPVTPTTTPQNP